MYRAREAAYSPMYRAQGAGVQSIVKGSYVQGLMYKARGAGMQSIVKKVRTQRPFLLKCFFPTVNTVHVGRILNLSLYRCFVQKLRKIHFHLVKRDALNVPYKLQTNK